MKPERQIRATYADILTGADPATVRVTGDLDALYTGAPIPAAPPFNTLLATHARTASQPTGDGPESAIGSATGAPPRNPRNWLRQGFAFAGAAVAFAVVAAVLVLLFRDSDNDSTTGAQPTASPTTTVESILPAATPTTFVGGPNPDQIAFSSTQDGNPEIYLINADGSGLTRLTDDLGGDTQPVWSPDGARIAFVSDRDGEPMLYLMNADGSDIRLVTDEASSVGAPAWSPDGEWIAFSAFSEVGFLDVFIVHPDGSDLRQLTDWQGLDVDPAWSPTSQQIVYRSDSGQGGMDDIFIVNIDGTGRTNLTDDVIPQREPQWSSDGARIAFSHSSRQVPLGGNGTGNFDTVAIYNSTMQGGNPFRETDILGATPRWSPDGHLVAIHRPLNEPGTSLSSAETVHILNADTLESGRVPSLEGAMPMYDWSPEGTALVVAITNVDSDGNPGDARTLWLAPLDGSAPILLAEQLQSGERPTWRPDPSRTPEPSKTAPDVSLPTATTNTREPSEPVTPNTLDNLSPLQPGQERHFVFDISADFRMDESSFLNWNVKGSERMLPDGTLQQYMIARDASNTVVAEYVNDGERWWWNQRGWIEAGMTESGVVSLPEELRIGMQEPRTAYRALTTGDYELIDERTEGDTRITRYQFEDLSWLGQQLVISIESTYYEIVTTSDPDQVTRSRIVLVTPDDEERPEYTLADIRFTEVVVLPATDDPGNYVVPDAPAEGTLQYTPPATLPAGLTLTSHRHDYMGGMEWLSLTSGDGVSITAIVYPSRGSLDLRPMQRRAARNGNQTITTGLIAGGDISWISEETNGWPIHASWDNGHYRIELSIGNVTSRDDWNEDDLVALIYALAGEVPE